MTRLLLAPVTISPTKPLTPTHLKYLLSLDMLYRATQAIAEVTFLYHHASYAGSRQVGGFWEYLDRCHPGLDYAAMTEEEIGELYTAYHRSEPLPYSTARAEGGWIHPAGMRLLDLWEGHYRLLGMADPKLGRTGPPLASQAEILDLLVSRDLCVDARAVDAPAYLDATAAGLPLRPLLSPEGQPNYLLYLLRELIPQLEKYDLVVLGHDTELRVDYQIVAYVLTALGAEVVRFESPRVAFGGVTQSTRFGGWRGYTLGAFAGALVEKFGIETFRLGLRLYLVAGLGRTAREPFSDGHLYRWVGRARRLLDRHGTGDPAARPTAARYLAARTGRRRYADPYQVATALMSRDEAVPVSGLMDIVMRGGEGNGDLCR
jgi:hypothetical protein